MLKGGLRFGQFTFFAYFCSRLGKNYGKDADCQYSHHCSGYGAVACESAVAQERHVLVATYPRQQGDEGTGHPLRDGSGPRDAPNGKDGCERTVGIRFYGIADLRNNGFMK